MSYIKACKNSTLVWKVELHKQTTRRRRDIESHILPIWESMLEPRREAWLPHASYMNRSAGAAKYFKGGNSEPVSEVSAGNYRACFMEPFPSASLMKSKQHVPPAETYCWQ